MSKDIDEMIKQFKIVKDALTVLAQEHDSPTACLLLGILHAANADITMVPTIAKFVHGEMMAKLRVN